MRRLTARIRRKQADLPAYVVVPARLAFRERGTHPVRVTVNDAPTFRRSLKEIGDGTWFFELSRPQMRANGLAVGDEARFTLEEAEEVPPDLLAALDEAGLRHAWEELRPALRRQWAEPVFAAARPETKTKRIGRIIAALRARA
jgi:hypothetical protein